MSSFSLKIILEGDALSLLNEREKEEGIETVTINCASVKEAGEALHALMTGIHAREVFSRLSKNIPHPDMQDLVIGVHPRSYVSGLQVAEMLFLLEQSFVRNKEQKASNSDAVILGLGGGHSFPDNIVRMITEIPTVGFCGQSIRHETLDAQVSPYGPMRDTRSSLRRLRESHSSSKSSGKKRK
jgi:hypothetical protein